MSIFSELRENSPRLRDGSAAFFGYWVGVLVPALIAAAVFVWLGVLVEHFTHRMGWTP